MHEADPGDIGIDDVDFLQRRHDEDLKIEALKQLEPIGRRLVRAAAEGLVDDDEAKGAGADLTPLQTARP